MKKIGLFISNKIQQRKIALSDKEIFYLFARIIKAEYGNQGAKNLKATYLSNGRIFIKSDSSIFSNELLLNKNEIIRKINQEIGSEEIKDIKVN
jgi:hypothetical protein